MSQVNVYKEHGGYLAVWNTNGIIDIEGNGDTVKLAVYDLASKINELTSMAQDIDWDSPVECSEVIPTGLTFKQFKESIGYKGLRD